MIARARGYLGGKRLYQVFLLAGQREWNEKDAGRHRDSFELLD
ncbi:MAG: hypothetical protein AB7N76_31625 [Planctomycetota bacterium]